MIPNVHISTFVRYSLQQQSGIVEDYIFDEVFDFDEVFSFFFSFLLRLIS